MGSLGQVLHLAAFDNDDEFIAECQWLLEDSDAAVGAGRGLFEANRDHWQGGRVLKEVEALILAQDPDGY